MYYYQSLFYVKEYFMFCVVFNKMNLKLETELETYKLREMGVI